MIKRISLRITQTLIQNNAVKEKQETLVLFGIEQGLVTMFEITIMILTGILLEMFVESVIILLAFMPVRVYAGGYHSKTRNLCMVNSWLLFFVIQLCFKNIEINFLSQILVMSVTGLMIYLFCPIENKNKKLKDWEVVKYRRKCITAYMINTSLFILGHMINLPTLSKCMMYGMLMLGIMIFLGEMQNKKIEKG